VGGKYGKFIDFSDAIICVSKEHRKLLVDRYADLDHKTHHVYNPLPEISEISMEGDDFGFYGGRNPLKGYRILHKALKKVKGISGEKVRVHATMFPDLNRVLAYPNVDFLPYGRLGIDEFHSLYRKVGTVIVPSIWPEPLPYVVLEALIRGRSLIASNIGGIPEEVEGCRGVILCEPGNVNSLSEAMDRVIGSSKEDMIEWGIHNNKLINDRFNDKESVDKFVKICDKII
jgi:glycosyltransferase involved in cell wall biosynthesis